MSALLRVSDDISFLVEVTNAWQVTTKQILNGNGFTPHSWLHIDELLSDARLQLKNKTLHPEYDWERDIRDAEIWHRTNREWALSVSQQLAETSSNWRKLADSLQDFSQQLGLAGIKFAFVAHGAIGLSCLALLGQRSEELPSALIAVCIFCALVGIGLLAVGGIIVVEVAPTAAGHIRSRLTQPISFRRFSFLGGAWNRKIVPRLSLSNYFIYGSIAWLVFYVSVAVVILLVINGSKP